MADQAGRKGGCFAMVVGEASGAPQQKTNKETGEVYFACELVYWGGKQYIKLAHNVQGSAFKQGDWVEMECELREFKDNTYVGQGVVRSVNGKRLEPGA